LSKRFICVKRIPAKRPYQAGAVRTDRKMQPMKGCDVDWWRISRGIGGREKSPLTLAPLALAGGACHGSGYGAGCGQGDHNHANRRH
jgi:hypothetical protein